MLVPPMFQLAVGMRMYDGKSFVWKCWDGLAAPDPDDSIW